MERLTARDGEFVEWKGRPLHMMGLADIYVMAERLAAYEDTGAGAGGNQGCSAGERDNQAGRAGAKDGAGQAARTCRGRQACTGDGVEIR